MFPLWVPYRNGFTKSSDVRELFEGPCGEDYLVGERGDGDPLPRSSDEGSRAGGQGRGHQGSTGHVPQQQRLQGGELYIVEICRRRL